MQSQTHARKAHISPFYINQHTYFTDDMPEVPQYVAMVLPPHELNPNTEWCNNRHSTWQMMRPADTPEEAVERAKAYCHSHNWQPCRVSGKQPIFQQVQAYAAQS